LATSLRNRLNEEISPYLRQHETNPVFWFSWSEEAFRAAEELNRPIFLSIGYSTCYWCHVMEEDSFEDEAVAQILNEKFVCIKVDREERPDLDQIYMDAVVGITGQGGWPMSVFLTPNRRPFFGGTFFPKGQFIPLLEKIAEVWENDNSSIVTSAEQIFSFLNNQTLAVRGEIDFKVAIESALEYFKKSFDTEFGGFGSAPKFPQSVNLELLLRIWRRTGDAAALKMVERTLDALLSGGIYDHIGGGFHRYATDRAWVIPHFEKMLYDNALLSTVLLRAYQATGNKRYLEKAVHTLDYCLRDLATGDGGFASAEDAGEVGREGEFYVWELGELEHHLTEPELELLSNEYAISEAGNFEHNSIILTLKNQTGPTENLNSAHEKLLRIRSVRDRPRRDDKVLTSWLSLLITALANCYQITKEERFLLAAKGAERFQREKLTEGGRVLRSYCQEQAKYNGFLEDYSYLIEGLISLYTATNSPEYFLRAVQLQQAQDELFWDLEKGGYFFASADAAGLIIRKKDFNDGATPSGNSVAALNLLKLYHLTSEQRYLDRYVELRGVMSPFATKYPTAFATFLVALDYEFEDFRSIIIESGDSEFKAEAAQKLAKLFLPNSLILSAHAGAAPVADKKSKAADCVHLCDRKGCQEPEQSLDKALAAAQTIEKVKI